MTPGFPKRVGIATDHGGFGLKEELVAQLRAGGHEVVDFGAHGLNPGDVLGLDLFGSMLMLWLHGVRLDTLSWKQRSAGR